MGKFCNCHDKIHRCTSVCSGTSRGQRMVSYCLIVLGILVTGPGILMASSGHSDNLNPAYVGVGFLSFGALMFLIGLSLCCVHRWRRRNDQQTTSQIQHDMCVITEDPDGFEDYVERRGLPHSESLPAEPTPPSQGQEIIRCYVLPTSVSWPGMSRTSSGPVVYYVGRAVAQSSFNSVS